MFKRKSKPKRNTPTLDRLQREVTRHRNYSLLTPSCVLVHKNTWSTVFAEAGQSIVDGIPVIVDARQEVPEGEFWFIVRLPRA